MAYVESFENGTWMCFDSVKIAGNGTFTLRTSAHEYPDVYRLRLCDRDIYFPIDSTETVNVASNLNDPDKNFTISGSASAETVQRINERIAQSLASGSEASIPTDTLLKQDVARMIQDNWGSMAAYYAIIRKVGNTPLFDPAIPYDLKIIGAVTNHFVQNAPDDPRTRTLNNITLNNRMLNRPIDVESENLQLYAFPDINLRDKDHNLRSLRSEWEKGNVIILDFTCYAHPAAAEYNLLLQALYDRYHDRGLEIYQVDNKETEALWLNSARNIPWVAVFNSPADEAKALIDYNITTIPTTFVISRDGNDMRRIASLDELASVVEEFTAM